MATVEAIAIRREQVINRLLSTAKDAGLSVPDELPYDRDQSYREVMLLELIADIYTPAIAPATDPNAETAKPAKKGKKSDSNEQENLDPGANT